jgi:hypothetical protein
MPLHLAPLAGPLVAKGGIKALDAAKQLREEIRAADAASAGPELRELSDATAELRRAVSSQAARWRTRRDRKQWEKLRTCALQPAMAFVLAQRLVAHLHGAGATREKELAKQLGTVTDDETFRAALQIAHMDGRILEVQDSGGAMAWAPVTSETYLGETTVLRRMGYVDTLVESICDQISLGALLTKGQLVKAVRRAEGDHRFNHDAFCAALEQALADGKVTWLAPGVYGVSVEQLHDVTFNGPTTDEVAVGAALKRLLTATQSLRAAVSHSGLGDPRLPQAAPHRTPPEAAAKAWHAEFPAPDLTGGPVPDSPNIDGYR